MRLRIGTYTKPGTRPVNEDYVVTHMNDGRLLVVVADGLGGHDKGEVASKHVAEYIKEHFCFENDAKEELRRVINEAQNSLLELQRKEKAVNAMKSTVVVLVIKDGAGYIAHVGDSRGYVFDKKKRYKRTIDHSVPQMLALAGDIKEKDIRNHIERSSLLRVLGSPWEKEAVESSEPIDLKGVRAFLLCSDGFWELITERDMMKCLKSSKSPEEWLLEMAEIIDNNGKGNEMDNYTAGAVFVLED